MDGRSTPCSTEPIDPVAATASSPAYVELHARSAFSFLRGASLPEELALSWPAFMTALVQQPVEPNPTTSNPQEK